MYILHYAPDNASQIIRLMLEEMGLPYRTALLDRITRAQDSAEYRAVNPTGLIPALQTPDATLFETGAILLWLCDSHGSMAPAPGAPGRASLTVRRGLALESGRPISDNLKTLSSTLSLSGPW